MAEKLGDAYVDIGTRDKNLAHGLNRAEKRVKGFTAGSLIAIGAVTALAAAYGKLLKMSMTQEDAERGLGAALRANKDDYKTLLPILEKQASAIQQITKYGDENNLQIMTTLRNLGVQADALGVATKQAIGLATALDMDAKTAARYTALARHGEYTILQRYVPALRSATNEAEKQAIVNDLMNKGWRQAQEQSQTTSGAIDQLSNAFGDLGETLGMLLSPQGLAGGLVDMKLLVEDLDNALKDLGDNTGVNKLAGGFAALADAIRVAAGFLGALSAGAGIEEASTVAFDEVTKAAMDRQKRRKRVIEDIEGSGGMDGAQTGKQGGQKKAGFSFISPEAAIKEIQKATGKDDEVKKQTKILDKIDKGIQDVNKNIGQAPAIVGV
jgi:hypothetical protein